MGIVGCEIECDYCKTRTGAFTMKPMVKTENGILVSAGAIAVIPPQGWLISVAARSSKFQIVCGEVCATMLSVEEGKHPDIQGSEP